MTTLEKIRWWSELFNKSDFVYEDSYNIWVDLTKTLSTKEEAIILLDSLDDFAKDYYYVRDEIEELLEKFIEEKR